ncbi:hypothetical protein [Humibacter albus]|uniref:hypothetical protein n=1 Tax=Humibacter albus TaxID=427754 RepID=UPI0003B63F4F|nr:hypothetical protein [Humibacter albus]
MKSHSSTVAAFRCRGFLALAKAGKFGLGLDVSTLTGRVTGNPDGVVGTPLKSPSGGTGTLGFINSITMWTKGTMGAVPPLKSITETKEFQSNPNNKKIADIWQPIAKTWAAPGKSMTATVTTVDGTPAMSNFAQSVFGGNVDAKSALTALQAELKTNAARL